MFPQGGDLFHNYQWEPCFRLYSGGAAAKDTIIKNGGKLFLSSGAIHRGELTASTGGLVSAYSGSIIDFTLAGRSADDGVLMKDLSLIYGAPTYTITVSADQASGEYALAEWAEDFTGPLTIQKGYPEEGREHTTVCDRPYEGEGSPFYAP